MIDQTVGISTAVAPSAASHSTGRNGDEDRYLGEDGEPNRIANFHKGLPHNEFGEVVPAAYESLMKPLRPPRCSKDFQEIQLGGGRKLTNPQAGLATDIEGPAPKALKIRSAPRLESAEEAAEAVELYWMALLRNVPFSQFDINPKVARAADDLSQLTDFRGPTSNGEVTSETIFRGSTPGDATSPGAKDLTVGGELNKVAANIAIGRNMAGVHWRSDYFESVRLGERVVITVLFNQRKDYHEDYSFNFTSFDGDKFKITAEEVTKNAEGYTGVCDGI